MADRFRGKVLMISGATGIAGAAARLAAAEGAKVFVVSLGRDECAALGAELESSGAAVRTLAGDLTSAETARRAVKACVSVFGRIDALFHVAGGSGRRFGDGPWHECSDEGWRETLDRNLTSTFLLARETLQQMIRQEPGENGQRGAIVLTGSITAFHPEPQRFATHAYAAAKGAIEALTRAAAAYYAPHKIRINAVAPGLVRTPMSRRAQQDPEIMEFIARKQALAGGILEPEDVARAALFLLSNEARHITGEILAVDGGWRVG